MKKFTFTLDPLLEVRKRKEDAVKLEYGKKNREIIKSNLEMQDLHDELKTLQSDEKERRKNKPDVQSMRQTVVYRNKLKIDLVSKGNKIQLLRREAEAIQKRLTQATKERRAIEIIGEHRFAEWKHEYLRQEQNFNDDVSQQGYIRKMRAAASDAR
jgi:flagellar export protein FliJ